MIYKELLNKKKQKITRVFAWIFGIATIVGIVLTIVLHKQEYWWVLMISTMFLFLVPFFGFLGWYAEIGKAFRIKDYLETVKERTLFDDVLQLSVDCKLYNIVKQYGFTYWAWAPRKQDMLPQIGFTKVKKKNQFISALTKNELKYFVGSKKIEEQDIEKEEWITVSYNSIKPGCGLKDLLEYLSAIEIGGKSNE